MNEIWTLYAIRVRAEAEEEGEPVNRRIMRDALRQYPALRQTRRSIFGMWRFRPVMEPDQ
jgi:hypothetical protein